MDRQEQPLPRFPGGWVPENSRAIDFSSDGIVVAASGSTLHFANVAPTQFTRSYSTCVSDHAVTAVRFHPQLRQLAIGDSQGSIFVWEIDSRTRVSALISHQQTPVFAFEWRNSILLVLRSDGRLTGISYSAATSVQSHHFSVIWEVSLSIEATQMQLNPHTGDQLLLGRAGQQFGIYRFENASDPPVPQLPSILVSRDEDISDVQWATHLPGHVYIVFGSAICIFSVESQGILTCGHHQRIASPFHTILQFPSNHKQLFVIHKSGTITIMNSTVPFSLDLEREVIHKLKHQKLVTVCKAELDDRFVVMWYCPSCLALYDVRRHRIVATLPLLIPKLTVFGSDGTSIAIGTEDGSVICTDLYDLERTQLFRVSESPVLFTSFCPSKNRVFWHTKKQLGAIDLHRRTVAVYAGGAIPVRRAVGSFEGGLLVQRANQVLGVFVEEREVPILLDADVLDFCFDDGSSNLFEGSLAVLLETEKIILYQYSARGVAQMRQLLPLPGAISIAWRDRMFVYGAPDGTINTIDQRTSKSSPLFRHQLFRPRVLQIAHSCVYGVSSSGEFFAQRAASALRVRSFFPIAPTLALVLTFEGVLETVSLPGFQRLLSSSTLLPPATRQVFIRQKLEEPNPYFSVHGRDAWLSLSAEPPMRLVGLSGVGDSRKLLDAEITILRESHATNEHARDLLFPALVFADRLSEASALSESSNPHRPSFVRSVLWSTLALSELSEPQRGILRSAAIELVKAGKVDDAALFFRFANSDELAIQCFLERDRLDIALQFLRRPLADAQRQEVMLKCGGYLLRKGHLSRAVPFLAGSHAFHPLLFVLYTLNEIADAFFLKRYAQEKGLLCAITPERQRTLGNIMGLDELSHIIDAEFQSLLYALNVPITKFFPETG
jgi:WD40 repeat protein